jgi:hypothetical protein
MSQQRAAGSLKILLRSFSTSYSHFEFNISLLFPLFLIGNLLIGMIGLFQHISVVLCWGLGREMSFVGRARYICNVAVRSGGCQRCGAVSAGVAAGADEEAGEGSCPGILARDFQSLRGPMFAYCIARLGDQIA